MNSSVNQYRQIVKSSALFGGVQFISIIVSIIKFKFIALLIGTVGMGISGLLLSTTDLIYAITNLGIGSSAVKSIAEVNSSGDKAKLGNIVSVLKKLVWITGIIGFAFSLILSQWLSKIAFNNLNYTIPFIFLSVTILLNQLTAKNLAILQGLRKLKSLAKANMLGVVLGLVISLPLYYFFNIKGIVPAILLSSFIAFILSSYFTRKLRIEYNILSFKESYQISKTMLQLGVFISISSLLYTLSLHVLRLYISNTNSIDYVGLYNAGFAIINTYVGLIFTAMATDYYPRLSEVAKDNEKTRMLINNQIEILSLILGPILIIFIIYIKFVIVLLYSSKFLLITEMLKWAAIGIFFKGGNWSISFLFLTKGNSKLFLMNTGLYIVYSLLFNILLFNLWGLTGLGVSFLLYNIVYFFQVYFVSKVKFDFKILLEANRCFLLQLTMVVITFIWIHYFNETRYFPIINIIAILSSLLSIIYLRQKLKINLSVYTVIKKIAKR